MKSRLILISFDAVSQENLSLLRELPNFKELLKKGTLIENVDSVFVSNTYPAHTSVITGCHPNRHGVIDNTLFEPQKKHPNWRWQRSFIKTTTLFDEAKKAGMKTCSLLWPVTGMAKIDYNFAEIFPVDESQRQLKLSLTNGSPIYTLSTYLRFGLGKLKGIEQPYLDDFVVKTAVHTIKNKKPELTLLHFTDADTAKHSYGPHSKEATDAIHRLDSRLGLIIEALKKKNMYENTSIIVFGDHSCLTVEHSVDLNHNPELPCGTNFHQAGGTAFLYVANRDEYSLKIAKGYLLYLLSKPDSGVKRILSEEEMAISGFNEGFAFGVEASDGYTFGKSYAGQHGYSLSKDNYKTFYLAFGKNIPSGAKATGGSIIDICPLAIRQLDLEEWDMDGKLNEEFK